MASESTERDLYHAIGRVASESANTEQVLRAVLRSYSTLDEAIGVIFEGQSFDWLADSIRAIFKVAFDALAEASAEYVSAKRNFEVINDALVSVRPLRDRRNFIIHGTWSVCQGGSECLATPSRSEDDGIPVFHFSRSRSRRIYESEEHLTVSDINQLADSIKAQNDMLSNTFAKVRPILWF
jgi:hypothetical protein